MRHECNCDPGDGYGHHVWCDIYRPQDMEQAKWLEAVTKHPLIQLAAVADTPPQE